VVTRRNWPEADIEAALGDVTFSGKVDIRTRVKSAPKAADAASNKGTIPSTIDRNRIASLRNKSASSFGERLIAFNYRLDARCESRKARRARLWNWKDCLIAKKIAQAGRTEREQHAPLNQVPNVRYAPKNVDCGHDGAINSQAQHPPPRG
jgi:hypothetical protein